MPFELTEFTPTGDGYLYVISGSAGNIINGKTFERDRSKALSEVRSAVDKLNSRIKALPKVSRASVDGDALENLARMVNGLGGM